MGSFLAVQYNSFHWDLCFLSIITTIFLQVLSNLANDYGDSQHGADSIHRSGPLRTVQAGHISPAAMKKAMILFAILSLLSGTWLIWISFGPRLEFLGFLLLGLLAIAAAVKYTAGKNPYGYSGFGDLSVFIFFGWVGVLGSFYVHAHWLHPDLLLPASACGFFSTGVLNVNNIRDIRSDALAGKMSIPVRIGTVNARYYHCFLLASGILCSLLYTYLHGNHFAQWAYIVIFPLFILNGYKVLTLGPEKLDPLLKQLAISTLAFVLIFGLGMLI